MILDKGFCTIYEISNDANPGDMPKDKLTMKYQSWYGELNFGISNESNAYSVASKPKKVAAHEGVVFANRIRIIQNRAVTNHDIAVLSNTLPPPEDAPKYNIIRAYHGIDEENGQPITDLSLEWIEEDNDDDES